MRKIGIDIGGTKIEGILVDDQYKIKKKIRILTDQQKGYDFVIRSIVNLIHDLKRNEEKVTIGIGLPGRISSQSNKIEECSISCMRNQLFKQDIEIKINQEIKIENDANCFTLAESVLGAGKEFDTVVGITIGTGVGAGLCKNKKLYHVKHRISMELGHMTLYPHGRNCYCGKQGCVESYISGMALEHQWKELTGSSEKTQSIIEKIDTLHGSQLKVEFLENFGIALGNMINLLSPEIIILGGGLSNISFLYDEGKQKVISNVFESQKDMQIVKAKFGDSAGAIGASLLYEKI